MKSSPHRTTSVPYADVTMIPQNYMALTDETALKQLNRTLDMLDEDDDVQAVYTNLEE